MEVAALGLKIDGVDGVTKADAALQSLAQSAQAMANAFQGMQTQNKKTEQATKSARDEFVALKSSVDSGFAATQKLESSTAKLDAMLKNGTITTKEHADTINQLQAQYDGATSKVSALAQAAFKAGALIGAAFSVNALKNYADAWSDMQSRVGAATGDMEGAASMMTRLVDIANASYAPLEQTAVTYASNVAVLQTLGRSAQEAADYTESLNHMLVLTATRGERAESVQNALSKAMAVGKLQADGLETVLANGGEVAKALADELGTTVSGLRDFAAQGKITNQVIASAIIKPLDEVAARAGEMPATLSDAFTRVNNNLTEFVGRIDKASGASQAIAGVILGFADGIRTAGSFIIEFGGVVARALEPLSGFFGAIADQADTLLAVLAGFAAPALAAGIWATAAAIMTGVGGALKAVAVLALANPLGIFLAALAAIGVAAYKMRDQINDVFGLDVVQIAGNSANYIIGAFVAAYEVITATWSNIGNVLGAAAVGAANATIRAVNSMISAAINQFNGLIVALNSIPVLELNIGLVTGPKLDELSNDYATALGDAIDATGAKVSAAFSKDYIGAIGTYVTSLTESTSETVTATATTKKFAAAGVESKDAIKAANKELEEKKRLLDSFAKAQQNATAEAYKDLDAIKKQVKQQEESNAMIGLSVKALSDLEVAKIKDEAASKRRIAAQIYQADGDTKEAQAYREMANELERLAFLKEEGAMAKANKAAQDEIAKTWEKTSETIGKTLQDYIMGGGKDAAQYLKRLFSTLILEPIVNYGMQGLMGMLGGGGGAPGAAGGQSGGFFSGLSNAGGGFTNWGGWGGTASSTIGNLGNSIGGNLGESLVSLGSTVSEFDAWLSKVPGFEGGLGSVAGYATAIFSAFNGDYFSALGGAIGTYFLPGIGTMIGSWLGGLLDGLDGSGDVHEGAIGFFNSTAGSGSYQSGPNPYNSAIGDTLEAIAVGVGGSLGYFLESFGLNSNVDVRTNWLDDFDGDGASWGNLSIAIQNAQGEWEDLVNWAEQPWDSKWAPREFAAMEEGLEQYMEAVTRSYVDALQQIDLPSWVSDVLGGIGDDTSLEDITATLNQLGVMRSTLAGWQDQLIEFANVGDDAFGALMQNMGGFENLSAGVSSFVNLYYSEQEKLEMQTDQLTAALAKVNKELPASKEEWRAMVKDALDAGEEGAELAAVLLSLGPAFASVTDSAAALAKAQIDEQKRVTDALYSEAGISGSTIAQILRDGLLHRLTVDDVGAQMSSHIIDGIYNSLAGGFAQQITQLFTDGVITPLLQAAATGSSMAGVVSQASMDAVISQARASVAALAAIMNDPVFQQAMKDLQTTIADLNIGAPSRPVVAPTRTQSSGGYSSTVKSQANDMVNAWKSVYDAILGSMKSLRDDVLGTTQDGGEAFYQSQFAMLTAQARAGDINAAKQLPDLVDKLAQYAKENSYSMYDQNSALAGYLASLEQTNQYVAGFYQKAGGKTTDLEAFAGSAAYVASGTTAAAGGRSVVSAVNMAGMGSTFNDNAAMMAEFRAMLVELRAIRESNGEIELSARNLDRNVGEVINGGDPINVRVVETV